MTLPAGWREDPRESVSGSGRRRFLLSAAAAGGALIGGRIARADEAAPGSGFGLAIVRDLAELYGGSIALEHSPLGGLRASLRLRES